MRAHAEMLEFSIGDRVCFHAGGHGVVEGNTPRYNRQTVTVTAPPLECLPGFTATGRFVRDRGDRPVRCHWDQIDSACLRWLTTAETHLLLVAARSGMISHPACR